MVEVQVPRISTPVRDDIHERFESWNEEIDPILIEKLALGGFTRMFSFLAGAFWVFAIGWTLGALYYGDGVGTSWIVFSLVFLVLQIATLFSAQWKDHKLQKSIEVITAKYFGEGDKVSVRFTYDDGPESAGTAPS